MQFGTPKYLYALAVIIIPIVIHLWSKNTRTKVPFGSLKFLKETETKTTKHLFPSELLLLAVRVALFACLAILFASPFFPKPAASKIAYLIDPNLTKETYERIESEVNLKEAYWLSPKKTPIADPVSFGNINSWSALNELSDYDSLVVYSTQQLEQFNGKLSQPPSKVNWVPIPVESKNEVAIELSKNDQNTSIIATSTEQALHFDHEAGTTGSPIEVKVYIRTEAKYETLKNYIERSLAAINKLNPVTFKVISWQEQSAPTPNDWLIWLSDESAPMREKLIYLDPFANLLDQQTKFIYQLNPGIGMEALLQNNFPLQLETALLQPLNEELDRYDLRTIPEEYLTSGKETETASFVHQPITEWVLALFLLLLLAERLISQIVIKK